MKLLQNMLLQTLMTLFEYYLVIFFMKLPLEKGHLVQDSHSKTRGEAGSVFLGGHSGWPGHGHSGHSGWEGICRRR